MEANRYDTLILIAEAAIFAVAVVVAAVGCGAPEAATDDVAQTSQALGNGEHR